MRHLLAWMLTISMLLMGAVPVGALTGGDADADGTVDTKDVRLYLKSLLFDGMSDTITDLNNDGKVDTVDVRLLLETVTAPMPQESRLNLFMTPANSSLTYDEIESARVARLVNTYEEFEEVCAQLRPCFYTPYETENGSFDAWAQTVTPSYFDTKCLFMVTHCTARNTFTLDYAVTEDAVTVTIKQSGMNAFGLSECYQVAVEIDKEDLVGRQLKLQFA